MTTKTFTLNDDGEYVQTLNGPVPKHMHSGPDLNAALHAPQVRRQARYGETIVGADVLDGRGNVVDEVSIGLTNVVDGNRESVMIAPDNSSLASIERREAFLREQLAGLVDTNGNPKLDAAGRDIYRDERYRIAGQLTLLEAEREYETAMQGERSRVQAIRAEQDMILRELARRLIAEGETQDAINARLRELGVPEHRLPVIRKS